MIYTFTLFILPKLLGISTRFNHGIRFINLQFSNSLILSSKWDCFHGCNTQNVCNLQFSSYLFYLKCLMCAWKGNAFIQYSNKLYLWDYDPLIWVLYGLSRDHCLSAIVSFVQCLISYGKLWKLNQFCFTCKIFITFVNMASICVDNFL